MTPLEIYAEELVTRVENAIAGCDCGSDHRYFFLIAESGTQQFVAVAVEGDTSLHGGEMPLLPALDHDVAALVEECNRRGGCVGWDDQIAILENADFSRVVSH